MSNDTVYLKNTAGQVVKFDLSGPQGKVRREILEQRVMRGELTASTASAAKNQGAPNQHLNPVVEDIYTGVRDEKGDLLRSVHGGGIDPDAEGDAMGVPSGSKLVEGMVKMGENVKVPVGDSHPAAAVDAPNDASVLPDDPTTGGAPTPAAKSK